MKVTTDACLFGAWVAEEVRSSESGVGSSESGVVSSESGVGSSESGVRSSESGVRSLLDIGSGTGLLALMIAQKERDVRIDAIEIDKEAAEQAKENADSSPWKDRIQVINADVITFPFNKKYDVIISNPPFYENELRSGNERKNTAHHSKNLTLGELLAAIKKNLAADGKFFLLLPYKRNEEIRKLFGHHQLLISKILLTRQSVAHDYFRIFIKGKLRDQRHEELEFNEMSIWNEKQQYTNELTKLLKDYYLHL